MRKKRVPSSVEEAIFSVLWPVLLAILAVGFIIGCVGLGLAQVLWRAIS